MIKASDPTRWILISVVGIVLVVGAGATIATLNGDDNAPGWGVPVIGSDTRSAIPLSVVGHRRRWRRPARGSLRSLRTAKYQLNA